MSQEQREQAEPNPKLKKALRRRLNKGHLKWSLQEHGVDESGIGRLEFVKYLKKTGQYDQDS